MTVTINLLPRLHGAHPRSRAAFRRAVLWALATGCVISGLLHLHWRERLAAQRALNDLLAREIAQLQQPLQGLPGLRAQVDAWAELQSHRLRAARVLSALPSALPDFVYLKGLTLEADLVTLRGVARSDHDLSGLLRHLGGPPSGFQQAELVELLGAPMPIALAVPGTEPLRAEARSGDADLSGQSLQFTVRARLAPLSGGRSSAVSKSGAGQQGESTP
ncbi:PilN domain-containing protein [Hylemonella sp. W303a]|uniref:PilN domain-containing protein n=1 Tax=Hylemonella sp. W303a TaxID=3389873 RepID=UPI00396AFBB4